MYWFEIIRKNSFIEGKFIYLHLLNYLGMISIFMFGSCAKYMVTDVCTACNQGDGAPICPLMLPCQLLWSSSQLCLFSSPLGVHIYIVLGLVVLTESVSFELFFSSFKKI